MKYRPHLGTSLLNSKEVLKSVSDNCDLLVLPVPRNKPKATIIWYRKCVRERLSPKRAARADLAGIPQTWNNPLLGIIDTFGIACWRVGDCYVATSIVSLAKTMVFNDRMCLEMLDSAGVLTILHATMWTTLGSLTSAQLSEHFHQIKCNMEAILSNRRDNYKHGASSYLNNLLPLVGVRCLDIYAFDAVNAYIVARNAKPNRR